jgi:ribosome-associated translation inhibitor RaiA
VIKVVFKNLQKSDMVRDIAAERLEKMLSKFPDFDGLSSNVIISREHSPENAGINEYSVKLHIEGQGIKPMVLEKRAENFYQALALVSDRALELLHRAHEKDRLHKRQEKRKFKEASRWKTETAS